MRQVAQGVAFATMTAVLTAAVVMAHIGPVHAQTAPGLTALNSVPGLSTADQTSLDNALNAVNTAEQGTDQNAINAALAQLASAMKTAATDDPSQVAALVGDATAFAPSAALTIAQNAAAGDPNDAAAIAVAVYSNLPSDLQDNADKTLIADAVATGAGVDSGVITTALGNLATTTNAILTLVASAQDQTPPGSVSPQ